MNDTDLSKVDFTKTEVNVDELGFSDPATDQPENEPAAPAPAVTPEPATPAPVEPTTKSTPPVPDTPAAPVTSDVKVTNPPTQYEGESDIQFGFRKQIYDAGQAKAMAETDEERSVLSKHIKDLRKGLAAANQQPAPQPQAQTPVETTQSQEPVDEIAQAKKVLNDMGYVSKDNLQQYVQEIVQGQSRQSEQHDAIRDFYSQRKDIATNPAQREALERLVVEKFNITPQSTKQDLLLAMDMGANYLFPKQNQTVAARQAADKRDLVNFSSNTTANADQKGVDDKTRSELKAIGWSDEDINSQFAD